jgi:hypothetical protein
MNLFLRSAERLSPQLSEHACLNVLDPHNMSILYTQVVQWCRYFEIAFVRFASN